MYIYKSIKDNLSPNFTSKLNFEINNISTIPNDSRENSNKHKLKFNE